MLLMGKVFPGRPDKQSTTACHCDSRQPEVQPLAITDDGIPSLIDRLYPPNRPVSFLGHGVSAKQIQCTVT